MALPALLSGLGRQLVVQGAKGAAKGAAKKMLSGKAKERNNNFIVKRQESPKVGYKKSSALVPVSKSINFDSPTSSPEVSSSTKDADGTLLTIKEKVIRIENLLGEQYKNRKKQAEKQRKLSERAGRKEKEELLEKTPQEKKNKGKFNIPIPGKGLFDNLMSRVFNFLFWVAIGKMLPTIIKFLPQIMGFLKVIGKVMDAVINVAGFILDGFITFVDFGFKVYDKIRGFAGAIGGEGLVKVLDGFTSAVETLLNLLFIISMASAVGGGFGGGKGGRKGGGQTPGTRPGQGLRPKVTTTGGRGLNRPDIRNPLRDRPNVSVSGGGTAGRPDIRNPLRDRPNVSVSGGGTAGRPDIRNPLRTRPNITTGAGKALAGEAAEKITKKTAFLAAGKFIQPFTKRIPIFGPIVDFVISVALGESVGRAAARAIGAGLGSWAGGSIGLFLAGAVGSIVPIAGTLLGGTIGGAIGTIIGGLLGDYVGGWLYDTVVGGNDTSNTPSPKTNKKETETQKLQEGGTVQEEDKNLEYDPISGKIKKRKIQIQDISQTAKDNKNVAKVYTKEGAKKIIDLANSIKDVPIIGSSMFSALNIALGNKPDQMLTKAIAYDLMSFSNLDSFENLSGSFSKLNSLVAMEGGGEVKRLISSKDSDFETSAQTLSIFLDQKINNEEVKKITEQDKKEASKNSWWDPLGLFANTSASPTATSSPGGPGPGGPGPGGPGPDSPGPGGPGAGGPGPGAGGGIVGGPGTPEQKALLDSISFAEGTSKSYGTVYGGKVIPELERGEMTVAQVLEMQKTGTFNGIQYIPPNGYDSDATGRYQFMSYTLKEEIQKQGVPMDAKFTPALQDKLILGRLARYRGVTPELLSKEGLSTNVLDKLAPEFASFPYSPKGNQSYYGQPVKSPESIRNSFNDALGRRKEEEKSTQTTPISQQELPGPTQTAPTESSSNNRGNGSKLAGELGRFLDSKGLGNWGSGTHQHPEHPPWPKESGHSENSLHYESQGARAIDIGGWGPKLFKRNGESGTDDQTKILAGINEFNSSKGVSPVQLLAEYNEPGGHSDHVHVAYQGGGLIRPRSSMSVPNSFTSYNNPSANTKVVMVPIAVPVSKPQMSPSLENSMGGFVQFSEVNSMSSRMNPIHQTSRS